MLPTDGFFISQKIIYFSKRTFPLMENLFVTYREVHRTHSVANMLERSIQITTLTNAVIVYKFTCSTFEIINFCHFNMFVFVKLNANFIS